MAMNFKNDEETNPYISVVLVILSILILVNIFGSIRIIGMEYAILNIINQTSESEPFNMDKFCQQRTGCNESVFIDKEYNSSHDWIFCDCDGVMYVV